MAKDFFVDLTQAKPERERLEHDEADDRGESPERTIRNIMVNRRAPGPRPLEPKEGQHRVPRRRRTGALWLVAGIFVIAVGSVGIMMVSARTSITVTPRVHHITFDETALFNASPEGDGLAYTVESVSLEEYMTVPAQGTEKVEDRATGNVTVYNEYSEQPVRLIKNTRFETPGGLIYRIPASVVVPGRKGAQPGEVTVTVIADTAGPTYNSGPVEKLTVPGLKSTPAMYTGVYARAPQGMSGGFVGERPAVPADALESARAGLRKTLEDKLRVDMPFERTDAFAITALADVTFEHLPTTPDPSGARVGERITARVPLFDKQRFAAAIAQAVSADAGSSLVRFSPGSGFTISAASTSTQSLNGSISFRMAGAASLVWEVDAGELKSALVGKEKDAFKPIVAQFPGIEKADANVAPFWSSRFPGNADKIDVIVEDAAKTP